MKKGKELVPKKDEQTIPTKAFPEEIDRVPIPDDLMERLPNEIRQLFISHQVRPYNPILDRMNEGHITQLLKMSEADDDNSFKGMLSGRRYQAFYILLIIAVFMATTYYFISVVHDPQLYKDIMLPVFSGICGVAAGYGINEWRRKK